MCLTSLIIWAGSSGLMFARPLPIFRDTSEIATLDWLAERASLDDVILAAYDTANYLPVRVGARCFLGHGLETMHAAEKERLVERFFDATTDDSWRQDLLEQYGVDYVFWGPAERAVGDFDPRRATCLREIYKTDEYWVFAVGELGVDG
jgi:uncharacterized membrane protein